MAEEWNDATKPYGIAQVQRMTEPRRQVLRKRYREDFEGSPEKYRAFLRRVVSSPFLTGENDRGWRADFDWCLKPANLTKIIEGKYDQQAPVPRSRPPPTAKTNSDKGAQFSRADLLSVPEFADGGGPAR